MQRQRRKVSSQIPPQLHRQVTQAAKGYKTTIGYIVEFGLRLAVERLKEDTKAGLRLPKDPRYGAE